MKTIAVYGSLRKGGALHDNWIGDVKNENHGTHTVPGFEVYPIASRFPAACPVEDTEKTMVVDVFSIPEDAETRLANMEKAAGYSTMELSIDIDGKKTDVSMYVMTKAVMKEYYGLSDSVSPVENGDWIKYWNESKS